MELNVCKNYAACPIFNRVLQGKDITSKGYRRQFCEAGSDGWNKCKRYLVKEKTGKSPAELLPNSLKSIDEIIL